MILLIDNYDSFTFNLHQYLGEVSGGRIPITVKRNDTLSIEDIRELNPSHILISPGPCSPNEAGISLEVVSELGPEFPILGVCLGHQCIGQAFGAKVTRSKLPTHGKVSQIDHERAPLFAYCPKPFSATRYHSLIVEEIPECLETTAWTASGEVMGLQHRTWSHIQGVQFHPESIMTGVGKQILSNFLDMHVQR